MLSATPDSSGAGANLDETQRKRTTLEIGKFPHSLLERLLNTNRIRDPRVVLGPQVGEDAAALTVGERLIIASSDPVTFASDQAG